MFLSSVVVATKQSRLKLVEIPMVREFVDVFLDKVPRLPLAREVEFVVDLVPGMALISRALYWMAPLGFWEVKTQLQNLLEQGLIRLSVLHWGTLVLFVKKNDGSMALCIYYRLPNQVTAKTCYPLPQIVDLFDQLGGLVFNLEINFQSCYH